jgi:hypothetical protein
MTVEAISPYAGPYLTNGIARAFPYNFRALTRDEVSVVAVSDYGQTEYSASLYSVALREQSGTVTFYAPPPAGARLYVVPSPSWYQEISFSNQAPFLPESHNEANDRSALRDLVLKNGVDRSIRFPLGEAQLSLPRASIRSGKILGFDALGNAKLYPASTGIAPPDVLLGDEVDVSSYPGTSTAEDPYRLDHDNVRYRNAQLDVTTVGSSNYKKAVRFFPGRGSGIPLDDGYDPTIGWEGPVPLYMRAELGDWTTDSWSPNDTVIRLNDGSIVITPNPTETGNIFPGVVVRWHGAAFRRPPRDLYPEDGRDQGVLRPYIFFGEAPISAGTVGADNVVEVSDYFVGNRFEGWGILKGENFRRSYNENANDWMMSGVTNVFIQVIGYASSSDVVHWGSSSLGPDAQGNERRRARNKNIEWEVIADGLNTNNRNAVSTINVDGEVGTLIATRFTKRGGAAALNGWNPATGVAAVAPHDGEPNSYFEKKPFYRNTNISGKITKSGNGWALLLPDGNAFPNVPASENHTRNFTVEDSRCGFTVQGGNVQARPYKIGGKTISIACDVPGEVLSAGCTVSGYARDCPKALHIGYFATAASDFHLEDYEFIRCGAASGTVIENRGWLGGSMRRVKFTQCPNVIAIAHYPPQDQSQLTRDVIFDDIDFDPNLAYAHYVFSGAIVLPAGMKETNVRYNGVKTENWVVPGGTVLKIPGSGLLIAGQEFYGHPRFEPGAPYIMRVTQTNTSGPPIIAVQQQMSGFIEDADLPASAVTSSNISAMRNMSMNKGRFKVTGGNAVAVGTNVGPQFGVAVQTPFSGTQAFYAGVRIYPSGGSIAGVDYRNMYLGVWFSDTTGGQLGRAVPVLGGAPGGAAFNFKYGDTVQILTPGQGGEATIVYTPAGGASVTIFNGGINGTVPYQPLLVGAVVGETIRVQQW